MANGKKNYFRHSFNAIDDEKIQSAIDKLGISGYAYFFILIELLAKKCENEFKNPITIHQQSLRNVWRKQSKSCKKVVTKLQESGLFVATFKENFIEFDIPNLSKYLGKYQNKNPSNTPNKKKVKESKVKESKLKENKNIYADKIAEVIKHLNTVNDSKFECKSKSSVKSVTSVLKQGYSINDCKLVVNWKFKEWSNSEKMRKFLRPDTLFGSKFDIYLAEARSQELKTNELINLIKGN